ncbi:growth hormone secretagogue receptor type 1-like [Paramacrobiotus metropolitanus]|uniref:growth hormone secretagogue receptor type 1-like n=1 Tax=Paramacrobiotus metropolitanus TaxID=2943436 RepID=UPI002445EFEC|nr:growth hormone secretagogue receptor type 1-like [Paramacrobiotus metropolitanus]
MTTAKVFIMNTSTNGTDLLLVNKTRVLLEISADTVIAWAITVFLQSYSGAVLNIVMACLILASRRLRTGCGLLIGHCLIAHTALCLICYPMGALSTYGKVVNHWTTNPLYCSITMWIQMSCRYSSNWIETYIAGNRMVALCLPFKYRAFSSGRRQNATLAVIWICSTCLASLGCFSMGVDYPALPMGKCGLLPKDAFGQLTMTAGYYLPLAAGTACYILVYRKMLADYLKRRRGLVPDRSEEHKRRKLRKANMVFVAFLFNLACYLMWPIVLAMAPNLAKGPVVPLVLGNVQVMGYAMNPVRAVAVAPKLRRENEPTGK